MKSWLTIMLLLLPTASIAVSIFDGEPVFRDQESRELAAELLAAHGGMEPMREVRSLHFRFFTKVIGNPNPFYSHEALNTTSGQAIVDWPFWDATIAWDGRKVWSRNWPMPLPAGFFVRLSVSFLTLPWQVHGDGAILSAPGQANLPEDDVLYDVLRVTYAHQHPAIPGTFYEVYLDPDTRLMKGLRFDINHPGMVANPKQPIGPNYHVFDDYREFSGLVFPTFYKTYGQGSAEGGKSDAYHFVWELRTDQPFRQERLMPPEGAVEDSVSGKWWRPEENNFATRKKYGVLK